MALTYDPIATTTTTGNQTSVTFSSIPATYTDLVLICGNLKHSFAGTGGVFDSFMQFNSDTGTNYSETLLEGNGTTASSERRTSKSNIEALYSRAGDGPAVFIVNIQNYSNTTTYKTAVMRFSPPGGTVTAGVGLWQNTAAINSIKLAPSGAYYFVDGSVFTLYGIKAA